MNRIVDRNDYYDICTNIRQRVIDNCEGCKWNAPEEPWTHAGKFGCQYPMESHVDIYIDMELHEMGLEFTDRAGLISDLGVYFDCVYDSEIRNGPDATEDAMLRDVDMLRATHQF